MQKAKKPGSENIEIQQISWFPFKNSNNSLILKEKTNRKSRGNVFLLCTVRIETD